MIERPSNLEVLTKLQLEIEEVKELYASGYIKDEELSLLVEGFIESKSPVRNYTRREISPDDEINKEIIRLRGVHTPNKTVQSQLNLSSSEYSFRLKALISNDLVEKMKAGRSSTPIVYEIAEETEQEFVRLWQINITIDEIRRQLSLSPPVFNHIRQKVIDKGLIEKRHSGGGKTKKDLTIFYADVLTLRGRGAERSEIMKKLDLKGYEVNRIIKELIGTGQTINQKAHKEVFKPSVILKDFNDVRPNKQKVEIVRDLSLK